ncbi:hypothetical protein [Herbaspirillum seropedicae]
MHLERSKTPEVKAAWASMMEKFPIDLFSDVQDGRIPT